MPRKRAGWGVYVFYTVMWAAAPAYMYAADKIYKSTDEYGVPLYSNTPPAPGAEAIDMPGLSIIPPPGRDRENLRDPMRPPLELAADTTRETQGSAVGNNYKLVIVSPRDDETVPIAGNVVRVELALEPPLDVDAGHRIEIVVNGAVSRVTRDMEVSLPGLDRGSHQLMARVVNNLDEVVQSTNTITFHAQQPAVLPNSAGR
jgi:hypothetical protein